MTCPAAQSGTTPVIIVLRVSEFGERQKVGGPVLATIGFFFIFCFKNQLCKNRFYG
jgi:hypothetical protein